MLAQMPPSVRLIRRRKLTGFLGRPGKKMPGTRPGVVQQGGESDERLSIIAFESSDRARFLTIQEKTGKKTCKADMRSAHSWAICMVPRT